MTEPSYLSSSDKMLLDFDRDARFRASVASILLFDQPPDWDRFIDKVTRLSRRHPYMRQRLVKTPFGLAPPRWLYVEQFDLGHHVRRVALPEGGGVRELLDLTSAWANCAWDMSRPLWCYTLVEGLPGGQAALVQLAHHAVTDGAGGVEFQSEFYDAGPETTDPGPLPAEPEGEQLGGLTLVRDAVVYRLRRARRALADLGRVIARLGSRAARNPGLFVRTTHDYADSARRVMTSVPEVASPIMQRRGTGRRYDILSLPFDPLHNAAKARGATINEAFLTAVGTGLDLYHTRHDAEVEMLRVRTMIDIRRPGDPQGGNRVNAARPEIPTGTCDVAQRLAAIREINQATLAEPAIDLPRVVASAISKLPASTMLRVFSDSMLKTDALATNVPGLPVWPYVSGARVEKWYVFGPTEGTAVAVALISHAETCCVGITIDTSAIEDPEVLVDCLRAGFEAVTALETVDLTSAPAEVSG